MLSDYIAALLALQRTRDLAQSALPNARSSPTSSAARSTRTVGPTCRSGPPTAWPARAADGSCPATTATPGSASAGTCSRSSTWSSTCGSTRTAGCTARCRFAPARLTCGNHAELWIGSSSVVARCRHGQRPARPAQSPRPGGAADAIVSDRQAQAAGERPDVDLATEAWARLAALVRASEAA
jgi:hypothetical protein